MLLVGGPGSGKSMIAKAMASKSWGGWDWVSVSRLVTKSFVSNRDDIFDDQYVIELLYRQIKQSSNNIVVDGFPRSMIQAKSIIEWGNNFLLRLVYLDYSHISIKSLWDCVRLRATCGECGHTIIVRNNEDLIYCNNCKIGAYKRRELSFVKFSKRVCLEQNTSKKIIDSLSSKIDCDIYRVDPCHYKDTLQLIAMF